MTRLFLGLLAGVALVPVAPGAFAAEPPTHPVAEIPQAQLRVTTRLVPLGVECNRLRGVNFDADATAWIGTVEDDRRKVLKANPLTGKSEVVLVTDAPSTDSSTSTTWCRSARSSSSVAADTPSNFWSTRRRASTRSGAATGRTPPRPQTGVSDV